METKVPLRRMRSSDAVVMINTDCPDGPVGRNYWRAEGKQHDKSHYLYRQSMKNLVS